MKLPGRGKYEELCRLVLEKSKGQAAVIVVVEGSQGTGISVIEEFSLAGTDYHITRLPEVLRRIAKEIEKNLR